MSIVKEVAELFIGPSVSPGDSKKDSKRKRRLGSEEEGHDESASRDDVDEMQKDIRELKESLKKMLEVVTRVEGLSTRVMKNEERVKKVEESVKEIKDELRVLREENEHLVDRNKTLEARLEGQQVRLEDQEEKSVDQEARSRRNNAILHGAAEEEGEDGDWEVTKRVALKFIKEECKVSSNVRIERAHRMPTKRRSDAPTDKPRPLIVKFLDFNDKMLVRKSAKANLPADRSRAVSDDLPLAVRQARRRLHDELERQKAMGKDVWIQYPARLFVNGSMVKNEPIVVEDRQTVNNGRGDYVRDDNRRPNYGGRQRNSHHQGDPGRGGRGGHRGRR